LATDNARAEIIIFLSPVYIVCKKILFHV